MIQLNFEEKVDMLIIFLGEDHILMVSMIKILTLEIFKKEQQLMLQFKDLLQKL
jgi:hypothetical protein